MAAYFYIDTNSFSTATAVYSTQTLTTKAPDGYYSDGIDYRRQVSGVLQAVASCTPSYCPSVSDLSSITSNFVGSGGFGTWYFNFTYNGPSAVQATLWYRTRRDGIYSPNQFYPPYRYKTVFTPGQSYTLTAGYSQSPATYLEFEGFECSKTVVAPYVYYVNYDTEQGTTSGAATACAFGPATYAVYSNQSTLGAITSGTILYQDPYGYRYYSGGVTRWLAIGEALGAPVTTALELNSSAVVQQQISCTIPDPVSPTAVPCNTSANSGGSGITTYDATLDNPAGGVLIFDFQPNSVPDKLEIMQVVGSTWVKKATSSQSATGNYGPFDNTYGTSPSNVLPTGPQVISTTQFVGGSMPTRMTEFTADTGLSSTAYPLTTYAQQRVWWKYTTADYNTSRNVKIRITGANGTAWSIRRVCV